MPMSRRFRVSVVVVTLIGLILSPQATAAGFFLEAPPDSDLALTDPVAAPSVASKPPARFDPELTKVLKATGSSGKAGAFIHFGDGVPHSAGIEVVTGAGLTVGLDLPGANAVYAFGVAHRINALADSPLVTYLENSGVEEIANSTGTWASRARTLYEDTGGLDIRVGDPFGPGYVDGSRVGVAVVDSGVDATHPDLRWAGFPTETDPKVILNFKVHCTTPALAQGTAGAMPGQCFGPVAMQDVPDSDTTSGHGTHVAGIVAGNGTASDSDGDPSTTGDRMFRGTAPGAKLYGFGTGEGLSVIILNAVGAFQWILDNGASQNPPIKVVTNSWGGSGYYDPDSVVNKLADKLVDQGITVLFAAGNSGGDGSASADNCEDLTGTFNPPCTSDTGNNPKKGVIQVANYDDGGTGTRDAMLDGSSSRGMATNQATWPDVSAPGALITSTCKANSAVCPTGPDTAYVPFYGTISGTSMATPHVAGIVAMLYQINPDITPAEVEERLEDTAHKFAFGGPYVDDTANDGTDTSSFDKGHGLADARLAVLRELGLPDDDGIQPGAPGSLTTVIANDADDATLDDSLDLNKVTIEEVPATSTVNISWEVRATTTSPPAGSSFTYSLANSIDGDARILSLAWDGTDTTCSSAPTPPTTCTATKSGDTFVATYPSGELGADRGLIMFDAWASTSVSGGDAEDRAPGDLGATADTAPARGQEHVFVSPGGPPPPPEDPCVVPGVTILTDPVGDASTGMPEHDVVRMSIAEPIGVGAGKVMFILKMLALQDVPPNTTWPIAFKVDGADFFVKMKTDGLGVVTFASGAGTNVTIAGTPADLASGFDSDGTIRIVVLRSAIGSPSAGDSITSFLTRIRIEGGPAGAVTPDNMPDSLAPSGSYLMVGNESCSADPPPRANDDIATTEENTPVTIDVLANDFDPNGDPISVTEVTQGGFGSVVINGDDTVTYSPNANASGTDIFDYTITDPAGQTATAQVFVTVTPFPCPSSPSGSFFDDLEPTPEPGWEMDTSANGDTILTWTSVNDQFAQSPTHSFFSEAESFGKDDRLIAPPQDLSTTSQLSFWHRFTFETDFDGGVLEVSKDGGTIWQDVVTAGGSFVQGGYNGTIDPATASAIAGRPAWTGSSGSDTDMTEVVVNLGALASSDVLLRWRLATDGILGDTGWFLDDVEFTNLSVVSDCNRPPNARNDVANVTEGQSVTITVLGNDTDPDGDSLDVASTTDPPNGTAVINPDNTITYTPDNGPGSDSFEYTITDGNGGFDTARVDVTITEDPNSPPLANDDTATTPKNIEVVIPVLLNDSDPDGDPLSITAVTDPPSGTSANNNDGTVTYMPNSGFTGTDNFSYTVSDGRGGSDSADVTVTVTETWTLTVTKSGDGSGTVTSAPAGINCGADCAEEYPDDTSVTLTATPAGGSTFTGWSGDGCSGAGTCTLTMDAAKSVDAAFDPTPKRYTSLTPERILDTRDGTGVCTPGCLGAIPGGTSKAVQITGLGEVPASGVSAVVLNVTVDGGTTSGFLTVFPSDAIRPNTSNLNYEPGQAVPNLVKVKLGSDGRVKAFNSVGNVHVIFDVAGWYSDGSEVMTHGAYTPVDPARILDTRGGAGIPVAGGSSINVQVTGQGGVSATGVSAAAINVTVTEPTSSGYLTVWPAGIDRPLASNLNFSPGQTVPNMAIVKTEVAGQVSVFNSGPGTVHVIIDVAGWYNDDTITVNGGSYDPLVPERILDTRNTVALAPGEEREVQITGLGGVPVAGVGAVVMNTTVTEPGDIGYLTVYPAGTDRPLASNLNWSAGQTIPNLVIVKVGTNGKVVLYNGSNSTAQVILDLAGWFDTS